MTGEESHSQNRRIRQPGQEGRREESGKEEYNNRGHAKNQTARTGRRRDKEEYKTDMRRTRQPSRTEGHAKNQIARTGGRREESDKEEPDSQDRRKAGRER